LAATAALAQEDGVADAVAASRAPAEAQSPTASMTHGGAGTSGSAGGQEMEMEALGLSQRILLHATAGTDAEPNSTPFAMMTTRRAGWRLMLDGQAFLNELQQSGPRGADKLFSTNWIMPMAQHELGGGELTLRTMLSFEPATVSQRRYPELFQQGETAFGQGIVDGQHPHDLFMELAALYDYRLGENTTLSFYAAPMGNPAMGPGAYPHRASAAENPLAPLGHHLQDSTHVADDVLTLGVTYRNLRVEASGFHGREPDEHRWDLDSGAIDSWSARLTLNLGGNWSGQYSFAQLHSPESLSPNENVQRMTASLIYNRRVRKGNWSSMLAWGRNRSLRDGNVGNSYLLESTLKLGKNAAWTRIENVDRTNELLPGGSAAAQAISEDGYFTRVQAYTAGYDREIATTRFLSTAIGGQVTWYGVPAVLKPFYGSHPAGALIFLRLRTR
jgi:hypothetical protein